MWTRAELKERAKQVLRKYYWIAFLVTLVGGILGGGSGQMPNFTYSFNRNYGNGGYGGFSNAIGRIDWGDPNSIAVLVGILTGVAAFSAIFLIVFAIGFAWQIFLGGPIEAGMSRYFLEARQGRSEFVNLFYSFRNGRYLSTVKALAWRLLFTILWTLLFIIPGIIKGYAYSMVPYIMADNPNMDYKRALKLSMAMTDGQKWEIFVLDLSFIGWYLLGLLACCIGVIFVEPYYYATRAELYVSLRQKALDQGLCTAEELGLQPEAVTVV